MALLAHTATQTLLSLAQLPLLDADTDPLQILRDPASWVNDWFWGSAFGVKHGDGYAWVGQSLDFLLRVGAAKPGQSCTAGSTDLGCVYFRIWQTMATGGDLLVALALTLRIVRVVSDRRKHRNTARLLIVDVAARGFPAVAAIQLSYTFLVFLLDQSIVLGTLLLDASLSSIPNETLSLQAAIGQILGGLNGGGLAILVTLLLFAYLMLLITGSRIAVLFGIAIAPLVIPAWVYSEKNDLFRWWARIIAQGLLTPVVLGGLLGVALVAIHTSSQLGGPLAGIIMLITAAGSLWFVGQAVHKLMGDLFHVHHGLMEGLVFFLIGVNQVIGLRQALPKSPQKP